MRGVKNVLPIKMNKIFANKTVISLFSFLNINSKTKGIKAILMNHIKLSLSQRVFLKDENDVWY